MAKIPYQLQLDLTFPSDEKANIVQQSLLPDMGRIDERRSKTEINRHKNVLSIEINAKDAVAFRAAANSHLKLIALSNQIIEGDTNGH